MDLVPKKAPIFPRVSELFVGICFTAFSQIVLAYASLYIANYASVWSVPLWPASGAALAAVLLGGPWMLVGVFLGLLPSQLFFWGAVPTTTAILLPLANVAETALAWFLLRKVARQFNDWLTTPRDLVTFFILAPWLPALLSATFAQTLLQATRQLPASSMQNEVLVYAIGNACGLILITPIILLWRNFFRTLRRPDRLSLQALGLAALVLFGVWALRRHESFYQILLLAFPPLVIWGVWSTGLKGAVLNCCALSFLLFSITPNQPFDLRLVAKHASAPSLVQPPHPSAPDLISPKSQLLQEPLMFQITFLMIVCLTLSPLGLASDSLRASAQKDRLMMEALKTSIWSWSPLTGYKIEIVPIAKLLPPKINLFQVGQNSGTVKIPAADPLLPSFRSYWLVTQFSPTGAPAHVIGLLQSLAASEQVEKAEKNTAIVRMEMSALRARLNPHLLFNTLTGLRALIQRDPVQAKEFTGHLANFLRLSVDTQARPLIPLREELKLCQAYLALGQFRGAKLEADLQIDPAALDRTVPPMTVQALVENAHKHGSPHKSRRFPIHIVAQTLSPHGLVITVSQPGKITARPPTKKTAGLKLVREHLRLFYGQRASLELLPQPRGHVTAKIEILAPPLLF